MQYVIIVLLMVIIGFLSYQLYEIKKDKPTKEETKRMKEIADRERIHYNKMMNFSAKQAYGGK